MDRPKIIVGFRIGKLTVTSATSQRKNGYTVWNCTCDCGGSIDLDTRTLQRGTVRDCGCETKVILSLILLGLFYAICFLLIAVEKEKSEVSINLERDRQRYQEESITDPLTRVGNRQALRMAFQRMEADRDNQYFLAMMDLDDFKLLNDTYGHNCGDRFLQSLGSILLAAATDQVMPFRFGGDEFCVLFCGCQREEVLTVCRMIQEQFLQADIHRIYKTSSVSIGIAIHLAEERPSQLIERADTALYQAKQDKGRSGQSPHPMCRHSIGRSQ